MATTPPLENLTPARRHAIRVVAATVAFFAASLTLMLWLAYTQITDYPTYDLSEAGAVMTGIIVSAGIALLALVTIFMTAPRNAKPAQ